MKKHAFKRITAMVLVFVMCVFLMPTNSLGVKAVTADNVLVEESQVSSEIGAENPASEVEVITSEEADLPAEETASEEGVSEVTSDGEVADLPSDEASEETGDVEPLDVLSENGTILLDGEATETWTLSYGSKTETYASFEEVSARIDSLNNANGVYTIYCVASDQRADITGVWPTKAAELIIDMPPRDMDDFMASVVTYYCDEKVDTDIKITINNSCNFNGGVDFKTLVVTNGTLYISSGDIEDNTSQIENLTLSGYAGFGPSTGVYVKNCSITDETAYIAYNANYNQVEENDGARCYFETLNITNGKFGINTYGEHELGAVVLTTNSEISDNMIVNKSIQGEYGYAVVQNEDNTYSVVLKENDADNFILTYGTTQESYISYEDVVNAINLIDDATISYQIAISQDILTASNNYICISKLPDKANDITFVVPETSTNESVQIYNVGVVSYPLEFENVSDLSLDGIDIEILVCSNVDDVSTTSGVSISDLTLGSGTHLSMGALLELPKLTYVKEATSDASIGTGKYGEEYGQLKVETIVLAEPDQIIGLSVHWSNPTEASTVLEVVNSADVWDNIVITDIIRNDSNAGYVLVDRPTENGGRAYVWEEDPGTEVELKYNSTIETFVDVDSALAKISQLNNADNAYTITVKEAGEAPYISVEVADMPEVAKSITLKNASDVNVSLGLGDSDGVIHYPLVLENVNLTTFSDLQTKDLTIKDAGFASINNDLVVDGTFLIDDAHIEAQGHIKAITLNFKTPGSFNTDIASYGGIVADNLVIPSKKTAKIGLTSEEASVITINNDSANLDRLKIVCFDDGYEGAEKVDAEGHHTFYAKKIEPFYYVTDVSGNNFGSFRNWSDLLERFDEEGDKTRPYTIEVVDGNTIGKLPSNASKIILVGDDEAETPVIKTSAATVDMPVELEIRNATLAYATNGAPVNINMKGKTLTLNDVHNIGNISGANGTLNVDSTSEVVKVDKISYLRISNNTSLTISNSLSNVSTVIMFGDLHVWGDASFTDIYGWGSSQLHYNIGKKLSINGCVTETVALYPYSADGNPAILSKETVVIDSCEEASVSNFTVNGLTDNYVLYKSGKVVKVGAPVITVFDNYYGDWTSADASEGKQFATINDAIDYVNYQNYGQYVIRLEKDVTTTETLKTIQGDEYKEVLISTAGNDMATLTFKGTFIVDGTNVEVMNVDLRNSAKANASVTLKNGANIALSGTAVNALTAPAGTSVTIANLDSADVDVVINGTAKCAGEVIMADNAVLWCKGALTAGNFTLNGEYAEVRILTGKAFTINGNVNIGEDTLVCINRVDKEGNLATIKAGTAMVTADKAVAGQFYTQNIMTGTSDVYWLLTKSGKVIKTAGLAAYAYVSGERGEFNPQFASFNEAKEYVAAQADGEEYVIELLCDTSGADLTDLPENLVAIVKSESATATSVKLTTSLDVTLSTNLVLDGVNLSAAKKTIYANDYELYIDNNGGITAARAKELYTINVNSGTVTFTAKDSTINNVEMGVDGTFKCPQFTGYAMG